MSIFNELLPKICEISNEITKNFNEELKAAIECLEKFEEEFQNCKKTRDKLQKKNNMTTLQSIHEDEDDLAKTKSPKDNEEDTTTRRGSKKRSKSEVDDMSSPEQEKRHKRNASVKAQSIISKQVNVNLTQKLRREKSQDNINKSKEHQIQDANKENTEPLLVQVKQEKVSLPPEPMELETASLNIEIKQESDKDGIVMPPPMAPVAKSRKAPKEKAEDSGDDGAGRRRNTRTKRSTTAAATRQSSRSTRASSRDTKTTDTEEPAATETRPKRGRAKKGIPELSTTHKETSPEDSVNGESAEPATAESRPKRTRAKRAVPDSSNTDTDKDTPPQEIKTATPDKPRPKRTRKVQKPTEKSQEKEETTEASSKPEIEYISPKEEKISQSPVVSPVLQTKKINNKMNEDKTDSVTRHVETIAGDTLDATRIISQNLNSTVTIANDMDKTMVLPNGVYNHAPVTPKSVPQMNETVVLDTHRGTIVLDKPQKVIMDATVVLEPKTSNFTEDNSLLTEDSDSTQENTPAKEPPQQQPLSAVKAKVQQFEEMATRVTRTKTRAMTKKEEPGDNQTPPDKVSKAALTAETLSKMNSMIFNGKHTQVSRSASKTRDNGSQLKSFIPMSTSKLSVNKTKDSVEENQKKEKEDARRKKEALLEAKRELQKRKREEKMAAAAAARSAAERERRAQQEAAARGRQEKQAHADQGRQERLKEAERKKQELARKVAETEERRRAEEHARQQRLAEEQKRAEMARKKQLEEAEAMKKEAALMAREIERRQKEFLEKQKLKQKLDGDKLLTPLKTPGTPGGYPMPTMEPVYMADGFEYLKSDEEDEPPERPIPAWSHPKVRRQQLQRQARVSSAHVDRLFSVRAHTPDLREIFPGIERARLKRTSSAVWRTPPARLAALPE